MSCQCKKNGGTCKCHGEHKDPNHKCTCGGNCKCGKRDKQAARLKALKRR